MSNSPHASNTEPPVDLTSKQVDAIAQRVAEILRAQLVDHLSETIRGSLGSHQLQPLLDVDDVAAKLRVSRRTVENLIKDGQLRPILIGAQRRFDDRTIDAFLRNCSPTRRKRVTKRRS